VKFDTLQMGSVGLHIGNSWTQAQFDNAKLVVVPEPGSVAVLAAGLAGFAGVLRRRTS